MVGARGRLRLLPLRDRLLADFPDPVDRHRRLPVDPPDRPNATRAASAIRVGVALHPALWLGIIIAIAASAGLAAPVPVPVPVPVLFFLIAAARPILEIVGAFQPSRRP